MKKIFMQIGSGVKSGATNVVNGVKSCVRNPRFGVLMAFMFVVAMSTFAQNTDAGVNAISSSTDSLKKYLPVVTNLCYALAGIVAIIGAISVYIKMNNEEQDVKKSIMMIVGACIFLVAAAQALPLFFGL